MRHQFIDGKMTRVDYVWEMPEVIVHNRAERAIESKVKINKKTGVVARSSLLATVIPFALMTTQGVNQGVFWDTFLTYIFPWMIDIAKVFCAIKIAQAFYQEKRGGRDEGGGIGAMLQYGKWLILFHLLPWGVELIDEIGKDMLNNVRNQ